MRVLALVGVFLLIWPSAAQDAGEWREAFGKRLQASIRDGNASTLVDAWDVISFADRVVVDLPAEDRNASHKGVVIGLGTGSFLKKAVQDWSTGHFSYLSTTPDGGIICRSYTEQGGLNYVEFYIEGEPEDPRLVDFLIFASGEAFSQTQAKLFLSMAKGETGDRDLEGLDKISALAQDGKFAAALNAYRELPGHMRLSKLGYQSGLKVALQADINAYNELLTEYITAFPEDPSVELLSIDVYFAQKEWGKCHEVLDRLAARVGDDPAIDLVRGNVLSVEGKNEEAGKSFVRSLQADPSFEEPHWSLLTILLEMKKFDGAVRILSLLERRFDYHFTPTGLADNAMYAEFLASPEGLAWTAKVNPQVISAPSASALEAP